MPVPIFLISSARSGSHLMRGFMRGGCKVEDLSEVFNPSAVGNQPQGFFPFLARRVASDPDLAMPFPDRREQLFDAFMAHLAGLTSKSHMLIDVKYNLTHHFNGVWHDVDAAPRLLGLIKKRGYPVIHLIRRNSLEVHCSLQLALATNRWFRLPEHNGPHAAGRTVRIDVDRLVSDLEKIQTRANFFSWCLRDHAPMIRLFYEDLLEDGDISPRVHAAVCDLVGDQLDLPRTPAYAKVSPPLRDYVENYPEVIRALAGTRFLTMIS